VKEVPNRGWQPTPDELVGMRVQRITPEYIREMRKFDSTYNIERADRDESARELRRNYREYPGVGLATSLPMM